MKVYQSILGVSFLLLSIWGVLAETETPTPDGALQNRIFRALIQCRKSGPGGAARDS